VRTGRIRGGSGLEYALCTRGSRSESSAIARLTHPPTGLGPIECRDDEHRAAAPGCSQARAPL
jgi:hypothetical protein